MIMETVLELWLEMIPLLVEGLKAPPRGSLPTETIVRGAVAEKSLEIAKINNVLKQSIRISGDF